MNPPQNVNNVLLNPCITAAIDAKAQRDQITPGTIIKKAIKAEIGSSTN